MLATRPLMIDEKYKGTIYTFKPGDKLDVHTHEDDGTIHYTIISAGSFRLLLPGNSADGTVVSAPLVLNWQIGQAHGAVAVTDGEWVNILK